MDIDIDRKSYRLVPSKGHQNTFDQRDAFTAHFSISVLSRDIFEASAKVVNATRPESLKKKLIYLKFNNH